MKIIATALTVFGTMMGGLAMGSQVHLDVSMAQSKLVAEKKQRTFVKVGLKGFKLESDKSVRAPINVCLVLDKSGSMSGQKIKQAKKAAISAINRLTKDDIVSVVTYDSTVNVIVPATKLSDRELIASKINNISPGGSTALFAGVSKGADEIRKFLDQNRVNRVLLLSDGLANVGPQSPSELGELGESLIKENISVTTIGLGLDYNEDLMARLANKSDGNHVFVEKSTDLVNVFNREFDDVLSVVAQEVAIKIECADGVRPVQMLNFDADITGQEVWVKMNQIYSEQEKYVVLEVELTGKKAEQSMQVADVTVTYTNMKTKVNDKLSSSVGVAFANSEQLAKASVNKAVMAHCVLQIANLKNKEATRLFDLGDLAGCRDVLKWNADYLQENSRVLNAKLLSERAVDNRIQLQALSGKDAKKGRKAMIKRQFDDEKNAGRKR